MTFSKKLLRIQNNSYHFHFDLDVCITLTGVIFFSLTPFQISWHMTDKIYLEQNACGPQLEGSRRSLTLGYEMQTFTCHFMILKYVWHLWSHFSERDGKEQEKCYKLDPVLLYDGVIFCYLLVSSFFWFWGTSKYLQFSSNTSSYLGIFALLNTGSKVGHVYWKTCFLLGLFKI